MGGPFGPYRQSERLSQHQQYAAQLLEEAKAYRCYCTPEVLDATRKARQAEGLPLRYTEAANHTCCDSRFRCQV